MRPMHHSFCPLVRGEVNRPAVEHKREVINPIVFVSKLVIDDQITVTSEYSHAMMGAHDGGKDLSPSERLDLGLDALPVLQKIEPRGGLSARNRRFRSVD